MWAPRTVDLVQVPVGQAGSVDVLSAVDGLAKDCVPMLAEAFLHPRVQLDVQAVESDELLVRFSLAPPQSVDGPLGVRGRCLVLLQSAPRHRPPKHRLQHLPYPDVHALHWYGYTEPLKNSLGFLLRGLRFTNPPPVSPCHRYTLLRGALDAGRTAHKQRERQNTVAAWRSACRQVARTRASIRERQPHNRFP